MHVFYLPGKDLTGQQELPADESHHAIKVLRLKETDQVTITDGTGGLYSGRIKTASAKNCIIEIEARLSVPDRNYFIKIAVAPVKSSDRLELMIEKLVELGVDEITFILTARSERRKLNLERLEKVAVSAMKQSVKAWFTPLTGPVQFKDLINTEDQKLKFIAHQEEGRSRHLFKAAVPGQKYLLLVGPEGDFTKEEIDQAINTGFSPVSLGNYRLRTETAAISACTALNLLNFKDINEK